MIFELDKISIRASTHGILIKADPAALGLYLGVFPDNEFLVQYTSRFFHHHSQIEHNAKATEVNFVDVTKGCGQGILKEGSLFNTAWVD